MNTAARANRIDALRVRAIFNALGRDSLHLLEELYGDNIEFIDPFHHLRGRVALQGYLAGLYANVREISFDFTGEILSGDELVLFWRMTCRHERLRRGAPVCVEGCSRLVFGRDGRIAFHRDYFDAGAMLYEHLPLLGGLVRLVRGRVK